MADCTQLASAIAKLAQHSVETGRAKNFDEVADHIKKEFPEITRAELSDAILQNHRMENAERAKPVQKLFTKIKNSEAMPEGRLQETIAKLAALHKEGAFENPTPKQRKAVNETLAKLRGQRDKLKRESTLKREVAGLKEGKLPKRTPAPERFMDDPKMKALKTERDTMVKQLGEPAKLESRAKELTDQIQAIKQGKLPESKLAAPKNPRIAALEKERDAALFAAKQPEKIKDRIAELNQQIADAKKGILPETRAQAPKDQRVLDLERERNALVNAARQPERVESRAKQLQAQIDAAQRGEIPASRPQAQRNPRLEALERQRDQLVNNNKRIKALDDKIAAYQSGGRPEASPSTPPAQKSPEVLAREKTLAGYEKKADLIDSIDELTSALKTNTVKEVKPRQKFSDDDEIAKHEIRLNELRGEVRQWREGHAPKGWMTRGAEGIAEAHRALWAAQSSHDISAPGRQDIFNVIAHPITAAKQFPEMLRGGNRVEAQKSWTSIQNDPDYVAAKRAGLELRNPFGALADKPELYQSKWNKYLPGVQSSELRYTTYLNRSRLNRFKAAKAWAGGSVTKPQAEAFAKFINMESGIGQSKLSEALEGMNKVFPVLRAPKFTASRFEVPIHDLRTIADTMTLFKFGNPETKLARKWMAKELGRRVAGATALIGTAAMLGAKVETDPRSADFLAVRVGNTRYDFLGGIRPAVVLMARMISGQTKNAKGQIVSLRGEGKKPFRTGVGDVFSTFARGRLSPAGGIAADVLTGENYRHQPVTVAGELGDTLIPFVYQDIYDAVKDSGVPMGGLKGLPSILGVGVQTYAPYQSKSSRSERPSR